MSRSCFRFGLLAWLGLWCSAGCATAAVQRTCLPDDACQQYRLCDFGSDAAYAAVRNHLMVAAGCPLACINACDCMCNASGPIYTQLTTTALRCTQNELCLDPVLQKGMNYDSTKFPCDSVFQIAQQSLIQLCGATNGICRDGRCSSFGCFTTTASTCWQSNDNEAAIPFYVTAYVMFNFLAWTSAMKADPVGFAVHESPRPTSKYAALDTELYM